MSHEYKTIARGLAAACAVLFIYVAASILYVLKNGDSVAGFLAFPGFFLVRSFRYAALYIPVYLLVSAILLILPVFYFRGVIALLFSLIPFLTIGLFMQIVLSDGRGRAALSLMGFFGKRGAALFLFFLFFLELVLMIRFIPRRNASVTADKDTEPSEDHESSEESPMPAEADAPPAGESLTVDYLPLRTDISVPGIQESSEPELSERDPVWEEDGLGGDEPRDLEELEDDLEAIPPAENQPLEVSIDPCGKEEYDDDSDEEDEEDDIPELNEDSAGPEEEGPEAKARPVRKHIRYDVPLQGLLDDYPDGQYWIVDDATKKAAEILKTTLEEFKISAEVTGISKGPVITMFEILPAPGVKLSKIVNLADNIALRLAASRVRIVAPIPGKHAVGIEVPNRHRAIVSFKEMLEGEGLTGGRMEIPVILGKDISGGGRIIDLVHTPHLLIAGATGSGKSVCVNSIICSVLYNRKPEEVRIMLIDPKIVELKLYNDIPHLLTPVITEPKRAFQALQYCIYEMERRYSLLDSLGVRDIRSFNRKIRDRRLAMDSIPYILIIIDEFADLMATTGKEMEAIIARLAAMSRAVGIHLVLATQRPSVDVITGLIKANIPSRIAFMVASKFDSRIIIDQVGAEKLLGGGDMLFTSAWDPNPVRIQGAFLSEEEVERITDHVKTLGEPEYIDDEIFFDEEDNEDFSLISDGAGDPLMDTAVGIIVEAGKASASYLQRRLKIGYNRAARLVEQMEEMGIVGPANGSKPRDIIHVPDRYM